jgi:membrane-associated phospholipid phosphatase
MELRARRAAIGAGIGVLLLFAANYATFHLGPIERLDATLFNDFGGLRYHPHISSLATFVARLCDLNHYVYLCIIPVAIALWRRRGDIALMIGAILLGANECTELLKPLLSQHRPVGLVTGVAPLGGSWPSGHATASMSLALCLVLAAAPRWRLRAAMAGAAFALGVTYSFLTLGWHYPSDAVGGFLVATTWTFIGVGAHSAWQSRRPSLARRPTERMDIGHELAPIIAWLVGGVALAAAVVLTHWGPVSSYVSRHERFLLGTALIGVLAIGLAVALLVLLRRTRADAAGSAAPVRAVRGGGAQR